MPGKYTCHVISHTHWDREWYRPFQEFRMRLVDMIDHLLELLELDPDYRVFHMDGQTIVLDDYLQIRPEKEAKLREFIQAGRILIGPWYNQPDEALASGEALIRNLMLGRRMGDDFGNWLRIGYIPDTFGHQSQVPQIFAGFGISNAIFFRGITTDQVDSEFRWESPDGTGILAIKLPDNNAYSNFFYRLRKTLASKDDLDVDLAVEEVMALIEDCVNERPTTDQLLFMDGVDHIFANPKIPAIIREVNARLKNAEMLHSTLPDFVRAVEERKPRLKTVRGELRIANRGWKLQALLAGTLSSRIHLKQANQLCQTELERWAEPFSAIAWTLGAEYPSTYLWHSWKWLLKNHPHDSICGCSLDQVHKDMVFRFDQSYLISKNLTERSLKHIAGKVDTESASEMAPGDGEAVPVVLFNPLTHERTDLVEAIVDFTGSRPESMALYDDTGKELPFGLVESHDHHWFYQEPHDIPVGPGVKRFKVLFNAEKIPSLGFKTCIARGLSTPNRHPGSLRTAPHVMENEFLCVEIEENGTLEIKDKINDRCYGDCLLFEDGGDYGDGWNYVKPLRDVIVNSASERATISVIHDSPAACIFEISIRLRVPKEKNPNRQDRSSEWTEIPITSRVTLGALSRRLEIAVTVDNTAKDHRLRVVFPSELAVDESVAENQFDLVHRPVRLPDSRNWREPQPPTHPQQSFVDISDGEAGLAVFNQGLPEYEVRDSPAREIILTLMRCVDGGVGGSANQQGGQLLGKHEFRFAVFAHAGNAITSHIWQEAHSHVNPLRAVQTEVHPGELPSSHSFLKLEPAELVLTTLKKAEKEDALVARFWNAGNFEVNGRLAISMPLKSAAHANLNEDPGKPVRHRNGTAAIKTRGKGIYTVLLRR